MEVYKTDQYKLKDLNFHYNCNYNKNFDIFAHLFMSLTNNCCKIIKMYNSDTNQSSTL